MIQFQIPGERETVYGEQFLTEIFAITDSMPDCWGLIMQVQTR